MSKSFKKFKAKPSVLDRTKEFENGPNKSDSYLENDSEGEDDGMDFAALVRNITSENEATEGMSENDALKEAFKILDCDQDGFISVDDLRSAMEMFESDNEDANDEENSNSRKEKEEEEEEELKEMIAEADSDGDGKISFDDFLKVLATPPEKQDIEVNSKKTKAKANKKIRSVK